LSLVPRTHPRCRFRRRDGLCRTESVFGALRYGAARFSVCITPISRSLAPGRLFLHTTRGRAHSPGGIPGTPDSIGTPARGRKRGDLHARRPVPATTELPAQLSPRRSTHRSGKG